MKKILVLLFGIAVALPALCQTPLNDTVAFPDTTNMAKGFVMIYPKPFLPQGEIRSDLFKVKWNKTVDLKLNTGGLINYQPESDQGTATHPKTMIRVLAQHIPMNADINAAELLLVQNLINEVVKPGAYVPPTTPTEPTAPVLKATINDHNSAITYSAGWVKGVGQPWTQKFNNADVSYTYTVGSSATMSFTGRRVEVIAEKCDNHPTMKVEILKGTQLIDAKVVDLYTSTGGTTANACPAGVVTTVFTSDILPAGTYSVKVSLEAKDLTKTPVRDSFVFDGFKVYE